MTMKYAFLTALGVVRYFSFSEPISYGPRVADYQERSSGAEGLYSFRSLRRANMT